MSDSSVSYKPWIGVDFDGTLAEYHGWKAWDAFGVCIPLMRDRICRWLSEGREVRIFTARAAYAVDVCHVTGERFTREDVAFRIQNWLEENGLPRLRVTHEKDAQMIELWDDRCVQVVPNTGRSLAEEHEAEMSALQGKTYGGDG